jgi:predicted ATPase
MQAKLVPGHVKTAASTLFRRKLFAIPFGGYCVSGPTSAPPSMVKSGVFSRRGDYWTIGLGNAKFPVKDIKGLGYIQRLLQHPGREFHALDLLSIAEPSTIKADMVVGPEETLPVGITIRRGLSGDAGEMLDAQSKRDYQRRLHELTELLEDQRERGNHERVDQIESEIDDLNHEIRRGLGIGGRDRRAGSNAERARLNVTRAIKTALEKISESDGESGILLERSIRTGSFCSYAPGPELQVNWEFSAEGEGRESSTTEQQATHPDIVPTYADGEPTRPGRFNWVLDSTPFVGRDPQRSILSRNLELARLGSGRVVTIGGEAGVGKTRLSREFCSIASKAGFLAMAGTCHDVEDAVPFVPFLEILESALRQASSPEAFREAIGPDGTELVRFMPSLAARIPGMARPQEMAPQQSRRLLFNSVAAVVASASAQQPLVLLIEDLHWADEGSLALLVHLARAVANLPVLIIANHRDERGSGADLVERALYELSRLPNAKHIKLSGLPDSEVADLLQALSGKVPPRTLVEAMSSATEGNPLFIRELYEHLSGAAKLFGPDGDFRQDLTLEEIGVPEGVRRLLAQRLSLLGPETRRVLLYGATIGKSFAFDLLVLAVGGEEEATLDHLEKAEQIGLLDSVLESREARFYFSHELVRQVILEESSAPRAQRFHLKIANAIEKLYADALDDHAIELAHHLLRAGSLADAEKTIQCLTTAAERETAQSANASAINHLESALQLFSALPLEQRNPAQELRLQLLYGGAVMGLKGWGAAEAGGAFERAQQLCAELGDIPQVSQVLLGLVSFRFVRGEYHSSLSLARRLFEIADRFKQPAEKIAGQHLQGLNRLFLGELINARRYFEDGITMLSSDRGKDFLGQDAEMSLRLFSGFTAWCLGHADWELREKEALKRARLVAHPFTVTFALENLAISAMIRREWADVAQKAGEARKLADKYGFDILSVGADLVEGLAVAGLGELNRGVEQARRGLANFRAMGAEMWVPHDQSLLAFFIASEGKISEAEALVDEAFAIMNRTQERFCEAEMHRIRGAIRLFACEQESPAARAALENKAEECFHAALKAARREHAVAFELRAALELARLGIGRGKRHEALDVLAQASMRCENGWKTPELAEARQILEASN